MKKILAVIASVASIVVLSGAPAHATWVKNNATSTHQGVSLAVYWERDSDNTGFKLSSVEISGCDNTCTGVKGNYLKCMNQDGTVKWSKTGSDINLGRSDGHLWTPNLLMPGATELQCVYDGNKYDIPDWNGPDPFHDVVYRT